MEPDILKVISCATARHADDTKDILFKGIVVGFQLMLDAYAQGKLEDPEWCGELRDMIAVSREHSRV